MLMRNKRMCKRLFSRVLSTESPQPSGLIFLM